MSYLTGGILVSGFITGTISGSTVYLNPMGGQSSNGGAGDVTDPANGSQQWCLNGFNGGTIKHFKVWTNVQPSTGNSYACTFVKNQSDQSVTVTIDDAHMSAKDTTHSFDFIEADLIALKVHQGIGGDTFSLGWSFWFFPTPVR